MTELSNVAPAFVDMAHRIVWATVATAEPDGHPRTRILHPIWEWDGTDLVGWIATGPTPPKTRALAAHPFVSLTYWDPTHDTCTADADAVLHTDDDTCRQVWDRFVDGPAPVGYDPAIVPVWADGPTSPAFAALELRPTRLRVFPGTLLLQGTGEVLTWHA